jgi:hypothetical protein
VTRALALAALLATGCATTKPPAWVPAEGRFVAPKAGFELEMPAGWMRRNVADGVESFEVTRDGTTLQRILAGSTEAGKPIGLGASKRPVTADLTLAELAELVVDGFSSAEGISGVELLESTPARLAGRESTRVLVRFKVGNLYKRAMVVGILESARLYWLLYVAPERRYFELDRATFEQVVESYRLRAQGAPAKPPSRPVRPTAADAGWSPPGGEPGRVG